MKQNALKKLIKEAVKEAMQEELKDILLEAVKSPKQQVVEHIQTPLPSSQGPAMSSTERRTAYQNILGDMQAAFGTQNVERPLQMQGPVDTTSPNGKLPEGNVSMDQIMSLMNSK